MLELQPIQPHRVELVPILRARKRNNLDWGMKYFLTAVSLLASVCMLGVVLA